MSIEHTEGIVLRGVDFSESSRIVTFVTPLHGKVACMVKGVRRPKSAQAPVLDTMNRVDLTYYWRESRNVQQLKETSLLDGYTGIKKDLERALNAALPLELAGHVIQENEPSEAIYATLRHGLNSLVVWPGDAGVHAAWQMVQLLSVAGFAPDPGEFEAETGAGFGQRPVRLAPDDRHTLTTLLGGAESCPDIAVSGTLRGAILNFAAHQLDCTFRSARVLQQVFG
jgi:DNA repair protein RecO (recombination protein O)